MRCWGTSAQAALAMHSSKRWTSWPRCCASTFPDGRTTSTSSATGSASSKRLRVVARPAIPTRRNYTGRRCRSGAGCSRCCGFNIFRYRLRESPVARRLRVNRPRTQEADMLWAIFVASLVLWAFGVVSSHTVGGRIHALLALAILVIRVRIIQGYRDGELEGG